MYSIMFCDPKIDIESIERALYIILNKSQRFISIHELITGFRDLDIHNMEYDHDYDLDTFGWDLSIILDDRAFDSISRSPYVVLWLENPAAIPNHKELTTEDIVEIKQKKEKYDPVHKPSHYAEGRKYEPRKVISDWKLNFNLGNAVKYISRAGRKDDTIEDIQKAIQYLEFELDELRSIKEDV